MTAKIDISGAFSTCQPLPKTLGLKIKWRELPGQRLQAYWQPGVRGYEIGIQERDLDPIQLWSDCAKCGQRMSFDTWQFPSEQDMSMFLLKWS